MNWITNIAFPITERTNIIPTLQAYNNACYRQELMSVQARPAINFSFGQTQNNGWNYFQNNNWGGSLFCFDLSGMPRQSYKMTPWSFQNLYLYCTTNSTQNVTTVSTPSYTTPVRTPATTTPTTTQGQSQNTQTKDTELANAIATNAEKYIGYKESDGSYKKFSNSPEWCADFVSYVVKESYTNQGKNIPSGFGYHTGPELRCEELKQWALANNKFLTTAGKSNKQDIIKTQVKPGDIVIMREYVGGKLASHTGIVRYVDKETGNYQTIEGNVTSKGEDQVVRRNHSFNDPEVSGFIQLG